MQLCETVCRTAGPGIHPLRPGYEVSANDDWQGKAEVHEKSVAVPLFSTTNSMLTAPLIKLILIGEGPVTNVVPVTVKSVVSEYSEHSWERRDSTELRVLARTTDFQLVLRLGMDGSVRLLPQFALVTWTRTTLAFTPSDGCLWKWMKRVIAWFKECLCLVEFYKSYATTNCNLLCGRPSVAVRKDVGSVDTGNNH